MSPFSTFICRGGDRVPVTVDFAYSAGERGARDRYGALSSPSSGPTVEIEGAWNDGGEVQLTRREEEKIELEILRSYGV